MSFNDKQSIFSSTELDYEEIVDIFKDEEQLYVEINVNLKNGGDIHKNIRKGSVLFDFLTSILELENAGSVGKSNIIRNVNLAEYREFVNRLGEMTIEVKEKSGTYVFYSFLIRDVKVQ